MNEHWDFGKNERSLKYVERCLQNFPGFGVWGPEECPVSWVVMEQSCELRMGYTVPKYRGQGNMWQIAYHFISYLISKNMPFYLHVAEEKEEIQKLMRTVGCKESLCGWHQWICTPKKYCWLVPLPISSLSYQWKKNAKNMVIYVSAHKKIQLSGVRALCKSTHIKILPSFSSRLQKIRSLHVGCYTFVTF